MTEAVERLLCSSCRRQTRHESLWEDTTRGEDEKWDYWWSETHLVLRCLGCESVSFAIRRMNSEDLEYDGQPIVSEDVYPPRRSELPNLKSGTLNRLPWQVRGIYQETVATMEIGAHLLSLAGVRATIEAVCVDLGADGLNLETKIKGLVERDHLTPSQAEFLHHARIAGNQSLHEAVPPPGTAVQAAFEILHQLLVNAYELPWIAAALAKTES